MREPRFFTGTCSTTGLAPTSASAVPGSIAPCSAGCPTTPGDSASDIAGTVEVAAGGPAGRLALRRRVRVTTLGRTGSAGWCWRECEVVSSYLEAAGEHSSAFRLQRDGVIRDSVLWCARGIAETDGGCSGDLVSYPDVIDGQQTVIDGNTVTGNLIKSTLGWYCIRTGNGTNWTITGNTFETGAGKCSEQSGGAPVNAWNANGAGNVFSGNTYVGGKPVTL